MSWHWRRPGTPDIRVEAILAFDATDVALEWLRLWRGNGAFVAGSVAFTDYIAGPGAPLRIGNLLDVDMTTARFARRWHALDRGEEFGIRLDEEDEDAALADGTFRAWIDDLALPSSTLRALGSAVRPFAAPAWALEIGFESARLVDAPDMAALDFLAKPSI
jgi:hypothetical protein